MKKIILITGGQRSGKSRQAEEMALTLADNPVYMATAHVWDDEFRERVSRHQQRRGPQWTNIEEEMFLSRHDVTGRVVVVDCVTLWLTNFFFNSSQSTETTDIGQDSETTGIGQDSETTGVGQSTETTDIGKDSETMGVGQSTGTCNVDQTLEAAKREFDQLTTQDATFIFVTNEIGSGGVSSNALQRQFTDLEGWMNQYIASKADEVIFMVSGIAIKIK